MMTEASVNYGRRLLNAYLMLWRRNVRIPVIMRVVTPVAIVLCVVGGQLLNFPSVNWSPFTFILAWIFDGFVGTIVVAVILERVMVKYHRDK